LAANCLLVLYREHPSQCDDDDDDPPPSEDEDIAEIEGVLLDAAVDVVVALANVLKDQFAQEFDPFYQRLIKYSVLLSNYVLIFREARIQRRGQRLLLVWVRSQDI
jgi:hypothetical protein